MLKTRGWPFWESREGVGNFWKRRGVSRLFEVGSKKYKKREEENLFRLRLKDGRESQSLRGTGRPSHLELFWGFLGHPRINCFFGFLMYGLSLLKFDHNFCNHYFT